MVNNKMNKKGKKKIVYRRKTRKTPRRSTGVHVRPDHRVVVKYIGKYEACNIASGYFDAYEVIKPYQILSSSAYAPLLEVYESMRVTKIQIRTWLGSVATTTPGYTAAFLYRDVVPTNPQRYAEQLLVEPGSKTGRMITKYHFTWLPIEPSDYEFYDHAQFSQMDGQKYGQINYAGVDYPSNLEISKPLIEYTVHYDFKSLLKAPVVLNVKKEIKREQTDSESDSEIEVVPRLKSTSNVLTKSTISDLVNIVGKLTTK